jgi:hypothetical protein
MAWRECLRSCGELTEVMHITSIICTDPCKFLLQANDIISEMKTYAPLLDIHYVYKLKEKIRRMTYHILAKRRESFRSTLDNFSEKSLLYTRPPDLFTTYNEKMDIPKGE